MRRSRSDCDIAGAIGDVLAQALPAGAFETLPKASVPKIITAERSGNRWPWHTGERIKKSLVNEDTIAIPCQKQCQVNRNYPPW